MAVLSILGTPTLSKDFAVSGLLSSGLSDGLVAGLGSIQVRD